MEEVSLFGHKMKSMADRTKGKQTKASEFNKQQNLQANATQQAADSAEEAGMMASKFKNIKDVDKAASKRQIGGNNGAAQEKMDQLYQKVPDMNKAKIMQTVKTVLDNSDQNPADVLKDMKNQVKDVTHRYIVLLQLKTETNERLQAFAGNKGASSDQVNFYSKFNSLLNTEIKQFMEEFGSEVKAGINMSKTAAEFVSNFKFSSVDQLREFYRDYVMNYGALFEAYKKILKKFKKNGFKQGKKFLLQALTTDMESEGPSISGERLNAIMDDMKALRAIERMHEESDRLFERMKRKYRLAESKRIKLIEGVIQFFDGSSMRSSGKKKMDLILRAMAISHLAGKINLVSGVKQIITGLPTSLFKTPAERFQLLQALQHSLDALIEEEGDEEYEQA